MADLAAKSIRRLTKRFQQVVGFEVTDDMLQQALDAKVGLSHALGKLGDLIANSDPLPLSANHQLLFQYLGMFPFSIDSMPDVIDATNTLYKELLERVDKGVGVVEKGAPRIIALLPSHHTDPIPDCLTGELGMAIASTEMEFATSDVKKWEDPYEELVALEILQSSLFASLSKRIEVFLEGCKRLNAEGVLDRFHVGCRTTVGDALVIKHAITKEMGIPVIVQERDDFDTRLHKPQQYTKEFKLLKTMLDSRERRRS
jgi:benzoyl-CoA reductase/2-hydroxyglutaryl-CoA dehydratase subunit BcrC/BadD/HgdB